LDVSALDERLAGNEALFRKVNFVVEKRETGAQEVARKTDPRA
jgi:hypothetical protein